MKKLFIVILATFFVIGLASFGMAEETATTSGPTYSSPNGNIPQRFLDYINEQQCLTHTHQEKVYEKNMEVGIGVDVVVAEKDKSKEDTVLQNLTPEEVTVQTRYDFNESNGNGFKIYAVASYRAPWLNK